MLLTAFLFGLLGSFHCIGMCGPIAFMLPVDRQNRARGMWQTSLYHIGRLLTYTLIGVLFGIIGSSFQLFGLQQGLSIAMGVLMLLVLVIPVRVFNKYNFSKPIFKWVGKLKNALGKELKQKKSDTYLTIGFLNGFLPCGLVYMAVFGAIASGSAWSGGVYMLLFGLGTVPLMSFAVYLGNFLKGKARQRIQRVIPVFVAIVAILFILRGLGLGIPFISPEAVELHSAGADKFCL
ncbi:MAG TPA: sulfite exporter TauE/SafE family protein [Flavobacteriaceae bacterium]|nr:sulfite exporter TauE/SafE family protein [Flavobacteriaceae bacterium]